MGGNGVFGAKLYQMEIRIGNELRGYIVSNGLKSIDV
jgi:hypothetical protein